MKKENNKDKINFFKKLYYAIFKIKKYDELAKDGLWKGIKYIMDLILLLSIFYAIIIVTQTQNSINNLRSYLNENLPDMVYENNMLVTNITERKILDSELVKINFGGQIVIDTTTEYEALIEEYQKANEPSIILTKDYFTTINKFGMINKSQYNEIIEKYLSKDTKRIDKEELLYLFDNFSSTYYFFAYMLSYAIAHLIMVFVYCLLLTLFYFILCKIKKIKIKFLEIYSMGLYAMTLTVFGYFILSLIPSNNIVYTIRTIVAIIPAIYLGRAIYVNKWITPEM